MIEVTYFSDPGCPWAYSVSPALAVLRWRYGDQLRWRLVTVGLTERPEQYLERGYTPARSARTYVWFRRFGMPFASEPRPRVVATARACRAIVATRLTDHEPPFRLCYEGRVFRRLRGRGHPARTGGIRWHAHRGGRRSGRRRRRPPIFSTGAG